MIVIVRGGTVYGEVSRERLGRAPQVKDGTYLWRKLPEKGVNQLESLEYGDQVEVEL